MQRKKHQMLGVPQHSDDRCHEKGELVVGEGEGDSERDEMPLMRSEPVRLNESSAASWLWHSPTAPALSSFPLFFLGLLLYSPQPTYND
jgi:hypothetical protein